MNMVSIFTNISRRSLRVLFALARGVPIVTEEWFYSCLSAQSWVPSTPHLLEKYKRYVFLMLLDNCRSFILY